MDTGAVSHRTRDRVIVIGVAATLAAIIFWYPTRPGMEAPALVQRDTTVLSTSFSMPQGLAGYYAAYPFVVPDGSFDAMLRVNFTVSEAGGQTVVAYLMNSSELAAYQSGAAAASVSAVALGNSLGSSGLTLSIGEPGTYYIVFTPLAATGTGQSVDVRTVATLDYTACAQTC